MAPNVTDAVQNLVLCYIYPSMCSDASFLQPVWHKILLSSEGRVHNKFIRSDCWNSVAKGKYFVRSLRYHFTSSNANKSDRYWPAFWTKAHSVTGGSIVYLAAITKLLRVLQENQLIYVFWAHQVSWRLRKVCFIL